MRFNSDTAFKHVQKLVYPRLSGTPGESKASIYIEREFRKSGLDVKREKFSFWTFSFSFFQRFLMLLLVITGFLAWVMYYQGYQIGVLVLGVGALFFIIRLSRWHYLIEKLFQSKPASHIQSQNIIARKNHPQARANVIFMAHYDTKSQFFPIGLRVVLTNIAAAVALFANMFFMYQVIARCFGLPYLKGGCEWMMIPLVVAGVCAFLLTFNSTTNCSPGALDNASGIAILLELARVFSKESSTPINYMFVATGAEEVGLVGAQILAQKYASDFKKENTFIINFDSCGASDVVRQNSYYSLIPKNCGKNLMNLVNIAAYKKRIKLRKSALALGFMMDHIPWAFRGFETVGISSYSTKSSLRIHSAKDTLEGITPEGIAVCGNLALGIVEEINKTKRGT